MSLFEAAQIVTDFKRANGEADWTRQKSVDLIEREADGVYHSADAASQEEALRHVSEGIVQYGVSYVVQ